MKIFPCKSGLSSRSPWLQRTQTSIQVMKGESDNCVRVWWFPSLHVLCNELDFNAADELSDHTNPIRTCPRCEVRAFIMCHAHTIRNSL